MNARDDFSDSFKPLCNISPTAFIALRDCALKSLWFLSGKPPLLPTLPNARAGTVVHRLLAEAGRGKLQSERETISARWDELIEQAHAEMNASRSERHLVPLTRSVPRIEVLRIRAIQQALEIVSTLRSPNPRPRPGRLRSGPRYGCEIHVKSADGLVRGVIDTVLPNEEGPVIRDYKSGSIFKTTGNDEYHLKEAYQIQLKIYAALYADSFDEWPTRLEIVPLSGEPYIVPFDRTDCTNLVEEARATLKRINKTLESHSKAFLKGLLANPTPGTCSYCEYRPACEPYWSAAIESGIDGWPLDVKGIVKDIKQLGNSKMMLRLLTPSGLVNVPSLSADSRHPDLQAIQAGDTVGVFNLWRTRFTAPYSESHLTTIYKLDE